MSKSILRNISLWIVSILIVSAAFINIIANQVSQDTADTISSMLLYSSTLISILCIIAYKTNLRYFLIALIIIGCMAVYQKTVVHPSDEELYRNFFIHGFGGFIIGYSITEYKSLINKVGFLSLILCVLLFLEPITHSLMNLSNMSTGYIMAPLVIWLFAKYFISPTKKYYLFVAIPISLLILFFCSRGCGLSIIIALILLKYWDNHIKGIRTGKLIKWLLIIGLIGYFAFDIAVKYIINNNIQLQGDSSFIARVIYGGANESSGRDIIWATALDMISKYYLTGCGIGNDRDMIFLVSEVSYVHNIILEILLNYGLIIGLLLIYIYLKGCIVSLQKSKNKYYGFLLLAIISMYIVRLLFSGSYLASSFEVLFIAGIVVRSLDMRKL